MTTAGATRPAGRVRAVAPGEVDPRAWDGLEGVNVYLSHGWLLAFADRSAEEAVLLAEDGDGRLLGGLPISVLPGPNENPRYDLFELFGRPAGLPESARGSWLPQLVAGGRAGYASAVPLARGLDASERDRAAAALAGALEARAAEAGAAALPYLERRDADLLARHLELDHALLFAGASARLEVGWPDFDGYLASLRSRRRSAVRQEMRAFEQGGLTIRVTSLPGREASLAPLLSNVRRKHDDWGTSVADCERYLRACSAGELAERGVVFLSEESGRPGAFSLVYAFGGTFAVRSAGFDYARCAGRAAYFNLVFYAPIAYAARNGLSSIDFGMAALEAKLLRGSSPRSLWSVVVPPAATAPSWWRAVERWNDGELAAWEAEYGHLLRGTILE